MADKVGFSNEKKELYVHKRNNELLRNCFFKQTRGIIFMKKTNNALEFMNVILMHSDATTRM